MFFKTKKEVSTILESVVLIMRDHFTKILDNKKKVTSKNVIEYLNEIKATYSPLDKINSKTLSFHFSLTELYPEIEDFKYFVFTIDLAFQPEYFSLEIIGDSKYNGFLLEWNSNKKKIELEYNYVSSAIPEKPTVMSKILVKKLAKNNIFTINK